MINSALAQAWRQPGVALAETVRSRRRRQCEVGTALPFDKLPGYVFDLAKKDGPVGWFFPPPRSYKSMVFAVWNAQEKGQDFYKISI